MTLRALKHTTIVVMIATLAGCAALTGDRGSATVPGKSFAGNFLAGRAAQLRSDTAAAALFLERALQFDPDNADLNRRTLLVQLSEGRFDAAVPIARRLAEEDPGLLFPALTLMFDDLEAGDYRAAERRLDGLPERGLAGIVVPLLRAWLAFGDGAPAAALTALDPLDRGQGVETLAAYHRGLILELMGREADAEQALRVSYGTPADAPLRVTEALGALYERSGRPRRAELLYSAYLARHPQSLSMPAHLARLADGRPPRRNVANARDGLAEAFLDMATLLSQEDAAEAALIMVRFALALRPEHDITRLLAGEIFDLQERYQAAIDMYRSVPARSPHSWTARIRAAANFQEIGDPGAAINLLEDLVDERPDRADAAIQLGGVLYASDRYAAAAAAYGTAIDRLGGETAAGWQLFYRRGIAYERAGKWPEAERDLLRALELEPDEPYVLNYLGYSWVDQGRNLERARRMIERAVALRPGDGFIVDSLGWVLFRLGDFDGAVGYLERAVELRADDPTINDHLGDAYWRVGRREEARFQWRRVLSLDPEPEQRDSVLDKLRRGLPADAR